MIHPIHNQVLVQKINKKETTTKTGIIIANTDNQLDELLKGKIVEISKNIEKPDIKKNDIVIFKKYSPDIVVDPETNIEYLTVDYKDIMCKVDKNDPDYLITDDYEKDTLQPNDPRFLKAYGDRGRESIKQMEKEKAKRKQK